MEVKKNISLDFKIITLANLPVAITTTSLMFFIYKVIQNNKLFLIIPYNIVIRELVVSCEPMSTELCELHLILNDFVMSNLYGCRTEIAILALFYNNFTIELLVALPFMKQVFFLASISYVIALAIIVYLFMSYCRRKVFCYK